MTSDTNRFHAAILAFMALVFLYAGRALCADNQEAAAADQSPKPLKIAVADITRISRQYTRSDEYKAKMEEIGNSYRQRERGMADGIKRLEDEGEGLSMGNPRRTEIRDELNRKRDELLNLRREGALKLDEILRDGMVAVYEDISAAVADYAKAHGIDLVLKQQTFDPAQSSAQDQSIRIGQAGVLYCAPTLDISDAIIEALNKSYQAGRKSRADGGAKDTSAEPQSAPAAGK